jgi:hypothetical protein
MFSNFDEIAGTGTQSPTYLRWLSELHNMTAEEVTRLAANIESISLFHFNI